MRSYGNLQIPFLAGRNLGTRLYVNQECPRSARGPYPVRARPSPFFHPLETMELAQENMPNSFFYRQTQNVPKKP